MCLERYLNLISFRGRASVSFGEQKGHEDVVSLQKHGGEGGI